jgi:hypothetical protein
MDFQQKYFKYKTKYLELKNQLGFGKKKCKNNKTGVINSYDVNNICDTNEYCNNKLTGSECVPKLESGEKCNGNNYKCKSGSCNKKTNTCDREYKYNL